MAPQAGLLQAASVTLSDWCRILAIGSAGSLVEGSHYSPQVLKHTSDYRPSLMAIFRFLEAEQEGNSRACPELAPVSIIAYEPPLPS